MRVDHWLGILIFGLTVATICGVPVAAAEPAGDHEAPQASEISKTEEPGETSAVVEGAPVFQPGTAAGGAGRGQEVSTRAMTAVIWEAQCDTFWGACVYHHFDVCAQSYCLWQTY